MSAAGARDYWPTEAWQTTPPEAVGMRPAELGDLATFLRSRQRQLRGVVIVRRGRIAFEWYGPGCRAEHAHNVASVTKSVLSALVGIAIDAGFIRSVDQTVLEFFPEYVPAADELQKRTLTLRNLLTMTAPVAWKTGALGYEPLDRLRRQPDWVQYALDLIGRGERRFQYSNVGPHLMSAILARTTGMSAREFANERLFRPLGMRQIPDHEMTSFSVENVFGKNVKGWVKDPSGINTGGWGLTLTPRDMARFGLLYLNRGTWDGATVIPPTWIDESTAPNPNAYGYYWWLKTTHSTMSFAAAGSGGNLIGCVPDQDLVVAIAARVTMMNEDPWSPVETYILPAIET